MDTVLGVSRSDIAKMDNDLNEVKQRIHNSLDVLDKESNCLPDTVDNTAAGLIVEELEELLAPFYPRITDPTSKTNLRALLGDTIKRFPNPEFKHTGSGNPRFSAKFLYDKTDALIYTAKTWGGAESRIQAGFASNELGMLRDPAFVLPCLDDADFNKRLIAVSCIAFLSSEFHEKIKNMAECDPEYGIRQSALWAYGLMREQDDESINFITQRSFQDKDERVREFALDLLKKNEEGEWFFI